MKRSISFCWLDLMGLGKQGLLILVYPFMLLVLTKDMLLAPVWTLEFVLSSFLAMPFQISKQTQNRKLQFVLPGKIREVVGGRFLYLILVFLYSWGVTLLALWFRYSQNERLEVLSNYGLLILAMMLFSLIVSCIQYMIFYRYTFKSPQLGAIITMIPNIIIAISFTKLVDHIGMITKVVKYVTQYRLVFGGVFAIMTVLLGILCYLCCVRICRKQDF